MNEARGEEPEEFSEVLEVYISQMLENLEKLETAVQAKDVRQVELIAHNCCGTSANCGMNAVVFFFQAEDGIRGRTVTGVQTCALPILQQLAHYDTLTHLPNRRLLLDRLDQALSQAKRYQRSMALMFLDLDHFKHVNDTLGHEIGRASCRERV